MVSYMVPFWGGFVSKIGKQIEKMRNNPRNWKIDDLKIIAKRVGLDHRQSGTCHVTFRSRNGQKLTVPARKPIKAIYIKQFLELINDLGEINDSI